ncbi:MAG: efflux RND transporter periplasmic adaptor subunit [Pseudomonadota bacterium]
MTKGGFKRWGAAAMVLGLGGLAAWGLFVGKPQPASTPIPVVEPPLVSYVFARPELTRLSVRTQGTVEASREVVLSSEIGGRVVGISQNFVEGVFFRAGDTLLQLEKADYELAVARAEARVASAQQELAQEEGRALQARREWRELGDTKANDLFLRKPQLAAAKASLEAAKAELEDAHRHLRNTTVTLPFDGRTVRRSVDLGQFVTPGASLAVVYGTDKVEVRLPVADHQLALLDLPLSATPRADADYPGVRLSAMVGGERYEWHGTIRRTDARFDENSRTLYAIAEVDRPFEAQQSKNRPPLVPGLFVDARIEGRPLDGLARLPRAALQGRDMLRVVDNESTIREHRVATLHQDRNSVWIRGLAAGDRVVVSNTALLQVGATVTPVLAEQLAAESH